MLVYTQEYDRDNKKITVYLYCDNAIQGLYSISVYIGDTKKDNSRYIADSIIDAIQWANSELLERV